MKILISHDVDHLFATDHVLKDLILEKLWVRSAVHLCKKKISFQTFWYRLTLLFHNRMHRIYEIMEFDHKNEIPSVFFFGMDNTLGMSYSRKKAAPIIRQVMEQGFDVGVHGVSYRSAEAMRREYDAFQTLSGLKSFGLRNHYVQFEEDTFKKMEQAGYLFDSTWFNKQKVEIRPPYRVGNMWEFPLHIMDGYICKAGNLEQGLADTFAAIQQAERMGMPYCTILFHDYQFDDKFDPEMKQWYTETIRYLKENHYEFISYRDAIEELERSNEYDTVRE